jgi:glyoxalase family protein
MHVPVTAGLHHVTLVARDARRTLGFYRDVLGLGLVKRTVNFDDPGSHHLYFGDAQGRPGTLVTVFEWPRAPRGGFGLGGVHHLALGVASPEGQLQWKRWLLQHGVPVSGPYDRKWFTSIYFADPDGQVLEIATKGPGYAVDEPLEALGQRVIVPGDGHLRGRRDERDIAAATWPEPIAAITPAMALGGLHHVTGITDDIARMHDFLGEALGLRLVKRSVNQDDPDAAHWFWANYDGTRVADHSAYTLFGWPPGVRAARPGVGQAHHVAFRAESTDDQLAFQDRLRAMGVLVSDVMDRTYFQSIYFRAPDGMLFEIATDGPGFAVDEPAEVLGRTLRLPAWLEAERGAIEGALPPLG